MPTYRFEWVPLKRYKSDERSMCVETYDTELMKLFLQQHGFDHTQAKVTVTDESAEETQMLRIFTFGSRTPNKRLYKIATTDEIVIGVAETVAEELSQAMQFGVCALRNEIEIFNRISDLINQLRFVYILENQLIDDVYSTEDDYASYEREYPYFETAAMNQDLSYLYESLITESHHSRPIQPITIESYVSIFVRSML